MALPESVGLTAILQMSAREVLAAADAPGAANESDRTLRHTEFNTQAVLNANSDPAVDVVALQTITIGGAPTDLDLISAPLAGGRTGDLTGKKVVGALFKTADDNAAAVTVGVSGSNDYVLWGAGITVSLGKGRTEAFLDEKEQLAAVAAGAKIIRFNGTNGDVIEVILILGTQA